jgi:tRNA-dihydrouridine synthase
VEKALRHAKMLIEYKGEYIGVREMRKHMSWYMKGLNGAAELRGKLNYTESLAEMEGLLQEYLRKHEK